MTPANAADPAATGYVAETGAFVLTVLAARDREPSALWLDAPKARVENSVLFRTEPGL